MATATAFLFFSGTDPKGQVQRTEIDKAGQEQHARHDHQDDPEGSGYDMLEIKRADYRHYQQPQGTVEFAHIFLEHETLLF
jgi:hypothetical protein